MYEYDSPDGDLPGLGHIQAPIEREIQRLAHVYGRSGEESSKGKADGNRAGGIADRDAYRDADSDQLGDSSTDCDRNSNRVADCNCDRFKDSNTDAHCNDDRIGNRDTDANCHLDCNSNRNDDSDGDRVADCYCDLNWDCSANSDSDFNHNGHCDFYSHSDADIVGLSNDDGHAYRDRFSSLQRRFRDFSEGRRQH